MQEAKDYLDQLYDADAFKALTPEKQDSILFTALELLRDHYALSVITPRAIALQTLYMLDGNAEEFTKLKAHGVETFSTKGISVSFKDSASNSIAPAVLALLGRGKSGAKVGRLI